MHALPLDAGASGIISRAVAWQARCRQAQAHESTREAHLRFHFHLLPWWVCRSRHPLRQRTSPAPLPADRLRPCGSPAWARWSTVLKLGAMMQKWAIAVYCCAGGHNVRWLDAACTPECGSAYIRMHTCAPTLVLCTRCLISQGTLCEQRALCRAQTQTAHTHLRPYWLPHCWH